MFNTPWPIRFSINWLIVQKRDPSPRLTFTINGLPLLVVTIRVAIQQSIGAPPRAAGESSSTPVLRYSVHAEHSRPSIRLRQLTTGVTHQPAFSTKARCPVP